MCIHRTPQRTHRSRKMITAFFVYVTAAFFVAIVANVAATVAGI